MPIYEYVCKQCGEQFEALVLRGETPACAACGGQELDRLMSLPYVKSDATRDVTMRSAKKRDQTQARERVNEQRYYEAHHDD